MRGTFEFKLKSGKVCTIEATYECVMETEIFDADGQKIAGQAKPSTAGRCSMTAYIDGKEIDSCNNPSFWQLIDVNNGTAKGIWGIKIGFTDMEDARKYEEWITGIMESGKSDEVKAYEKAEKEKENKEKIENAKKIIEKAEKQEDIPIQAEAERRMKEYNETMNEGGEGYVPHIISLEEYEFAKKILETVSC